MEVSAFRIVRSPGHSLVDLEKAVNRAVAEGWIMHGTHVWSDATQEWTQAMVPVSPAVVAGEVRLSEPKRR